MIKSDMESCPQARSDITVQVIGDEVMLYDSDSEKIHVLNHSAYAVWKLCTGRNTREDMRSQLAEVYADAGDRLAEDIEATVADLRYKGLLM